MFFYHKALSPGFNTVLSLNMFCYVNEKNTSFFQAIFKSTCFAIWGSIKLRHLGDSLVSERGFYAPAFLSSDTNLPCLPPSCLTFKRKGCTGGWWLQRILVKLLILLDIHRNYVIVCVNVGTDCCFDLSWVFKITFRPTSSALEIAERSSDAKAYRAVISEVGGIIGKKPRSKYSIKRNGRLLWHGFKPSFFSTD